jgi:hypothetical protein
MDIKVKVTTWIGHEKAEEPLILTEREETKTRYFAPKAILY